MGAVVVVAMVVVGFEGAGCDAPPPHDKSATTQHAAGIENRMPTP
jgi:hypothetical protein